MNLAAKIITSCFSIWLCFSTFHVSAWQGINCKQLPKWSHSQPKVNLHHVFCGELNRKGKGVGYHANPKGRKPSTYRSHSGGDPVNRAGIYVWDNINLQLDNDPESERKIMSSMFPNHCSKNQVIKSIQYAAVNAKRSCSNPSWAKCGPSAPSKGSQKGYCIGRDKSVFTIAVGLSGSHINTGFPIYVRN